MLALLGKVCPADELLAQVDGYEVLGNSLLTPQQTQQALQGATGRLTLADIRKAAQRLQEAYRTAGYGAVVVQVPQQDLQGHTVRLEVIEGKLSQIQVAGAQDFSKENILRSLPSLVLEQTPSLAALDSELLMVNENPAKSVRVVFQPGEKKAQVEVLIVVQEQRLTQWSLALDNTGNDSTGQYRLTALYQNANVWDIDAVLGVRFVTSPSEPANVAIASATFKVPLYQQKIFLELSVLGSNTQNAPSRTPAGDLNFTGAGASVGGRAIWVLPSLSEYKQQTSIGIERHQYRNTCTIGDLGSAGCGAAAAPLDVLPLTLGYTLQKPGMLNASVQWVVNLPLGRAGNDSAFEASRPGALSRYHLLRANALANVALHADWVLTMRADMQLSAQALVSAEQFGAGGGYSVRGYPERIVSGDSGALASMEVSTSLNQFLDMQASTQTIQASWFVDAAGVRNHLETASTAGQSSYSLWGTGLGLSWLARKNTSAKFAFARAGSTLATTRAGDWRLHFNLVHSF